MRSSRYGPPPREEFYDPTVHDYEMSSEEYTGIYIMSQILDKMPKCDYSQPLDDVYFKNGVIHSHWVVLFTCMPRDVGRLDSRYVEDYV